MNSNCSDKESQIEKLQQEINKLREEIKNEEKTNNSTKRTQPPFLTAETQLTKAQVERYSRQALLPECGPDGTKAFLQSKVVVIGCGGLGSTAILFLAASGVGHLVLVDADVVDRSNLHRQIIHPDARTGEPKVLSARDSALALNPTIKIDTYQERLTAENAPTIIDKDSTTIVLDCSDNVATRYLVNDICVRNGLALVSGAAMRWDGQLSVYNLPLDPFDDENRSPTYRCMHPQPPPLSTLGGCSDIGVFGPVPGLIGVLQALEALKAILHIENLKKIRIRSEKERQQSLIKNNNGNNNNTPGTTNNNNNNITNNIIAGRMLVWDAYMGTMRMMKMRPRTAAGVEAAKRGELKSLGTSYDGCSLETVSDPEIPLNSVEARDLLSGAAFLENGAAGSSRLFHPIERDDDDEESENNNNDRRRQRNDDDENDHDDNNINNSPALINATSVRNKLCDFITSKKQLSNHNMMKNKPFLKVKLILDVRKNLQRRLCSLEDLYHLPSFSVDDSNANGTQKEEEKNSGTLLLFLGVPFAELQKKVEYFMNYFSNNSHSSSSEKEKTEEDVLFERFLSELLLIGDRSCSSSLFHHNKQGNQQQQEQPSEHVVKDHLLTPDMIESFELFCLCRRGIDSSKSTILLEKLRRKAIQYYCSNNNNEMKRENDDTGNNSKTSSGNDQQQHRQFRTVAEMFTSCSNSDNDNDNDGGGATNTRFRIRNIKGGLNRWSLDADDEFPYY